jgi:hypothetical protein
MIGQIEDYRIDAHTGGQRQSFFTRRRRGHDIAFGFESAPQAIQVLLLIFDHQDRCHHRPPLDEWATPSVRSAGK